MQVFGQYIEEARRRGEPPKPGDWKGGWLPKGMTRGTPIDRNRYPDKSRQGLEGPWSFNGKVLYYDPIEGKYYDSDSDFYLSNKEFDAYSK